MKVQSKKRIKNISLSLLFWLIFVLLFVGMSTILANAGNHAENGMEKRISYAYRGENKDTIDVMFVGNSDVYRGISPVDLYHATGITSAVAGMPNRNIKGVVRSVKDILRYQHPKVLVLETDCLFKGNNFKIAKQTLPGHKQPKKKHRSLSGNINGLKKLFDEWNSGIITGLNYEYPLLKYHDNWKSLHKLSVTDFKQQFYKYSNKGMAFSHRSKAFDDSFDYMSIDPGKHGKVSKKNLKYVEKLINICKQQNIKPVFLTAPSATTWNDTKSAAIQQLADRYQVPYYDYNRILPKDFDWAQHTKDGGNHLNYNGARLLTYDFGHILRRDLHMKPTVMDAKQRQRWNADFEYFQKHIVKPQKGQTP